MNHNLKLDSYSYDELLALFELPKNMTLEQLKLAKKKVLMIHPDKSKLPSEYFLFYKKAFEVVVQIYENNNKINQPIPEDVTNYKPLDNGLNKATVKKVTTVAGEMAPKDFQNKFNELFENNMSKKPDGQKNEWFTKDEAIYKSDTTVSAKNMGQVFDTMKQQNAELVRYRGIQEIQSGSGTRLYEDDDEEDDTYVTCDPFSKLKFDDLRKVHKDQTIFAVSERDFSKVPQYSSVDHFVRERGKVSSSPLEKEESERILDLQNQQFRERMIKKEHASNLRTMQYEEKNKAVMSAFLQLKN
uniref:J domain-containing protein n=1 Tax=viral metagenome TaxID=1070528 RepID=A0A6C0B6W1_9ZZZZ